ncbi:MAG: chromosome segregation protein SMC [Syntrophales bacterium]|nr:chromosome segregation protein SMC [Syntrophales bacterium]
MKLKKIEILGFKSFRDKTPLNFSPGISAIVGPNGCGKSNVVDAIRWVMGEQRITQLRGKKMEDVIFHGSEDAQPVSMAEVAITLLNDGVKIANKYSDCTEVTVTRKIFRDGESEYNINNVPCRLLDIREFFMDAGVGFRTYSIVEQERVSRLIEAKPDERRQFIEEAAGVIKYKSRKESAIRKMEATRQNMLRLNDILGEVKSQLNATSRHAKKAERFKALKQEIKELQITLSLQLFSELSKKKDNIEEKIRIITMQKSESEARIMSLEASVEDIKSRIEDAETKSAICQEKYYSTKNEIGINEQKIEFLKKMVADLKTKEISTLTEINDLKRRRGDMEKEKEALQKILSDSDTGILQSREDISIQQKIVNGLKEQQREIRDTLDILKSRHVETVTERGRLKNILFALEKEIENLGRKAQHEDGEITEYNQKIQSLKSTSETLKRNHADSEKKINELREKKAAYKDKIAAAREELSEADETLEKLREQMALKISRLTSLKELQENFEWCSEGTRCIMTESRRSTWAAGTVHGLVADYMEVPEEYENAVEAALGDKLQFMVVDNQDDGIKAIDYLKKRSSGRGSFVPLATESRPAAVLPRYLKETVKLTDVVKAREGGMEGFISMLLGDVLLIPDLAKGKELWKKNGFTGTFVTPDGDIISHEGILTGGSGIACGSSLLKNKREISELEQEINEIDFTLKDEGTKKKEIVTIIEDSREELEAAGREIHETELQENGLRKDVERTESEISWLNQRIRILSYNIENMKREEAESHHRIAEIKEDLEKNEEKTNDDALAIEKLQEEWHIVTDELDKQELCLTEEKIALTAFEERKISGLKSLQTLKIGLRDIEDRILANTNGIEECKKNIIMHTADLDEMEKELGRLYESYKIEEKNLSEVKELQNSHEITLKEKEKEYQSAKKTYDAITQELNQETFEIKEVTMQIEAVYQRMAEKYQIQLSDLLPAFAPLDDDTSNEFEKRLKMKRQHLGEFGEVNLLALSEHEELKKRHEFLTIQHKDLTTSLDTLQKTISRINGITRKRFAETFEAVNDNFKKVFPKLFPGGHGSLHLTDETDMLETGVDIEIQIPGKKRQSLSLLSGGEKALSAVSLIFAILLHRPTPFLILDEADAPLDDTNVQLFTKLVGDISKESQIIYITHNKRTMEAADNLIGVTMQKNGISTIVSVNMN